MNYRHAYHAGNHGDVLKHVLLTRVLHLMLRKDKPLAVLDAHAGIGRYELSGVEAFKTGEWRDGIGKFQVAKFDPHTDELLAPYRKILGTLSLRQYPGSPDIIQRMLRPEDRAIFNELHPEDVELLRARYAHDPRLRITQVDALQAVKTELPFKERRGLLVIDPPYEGSDEDERVQRMVAQALHRMAQTVIMVWYPVIREERVKALHNALSDSDANGILLCELRVREAFAEGGMAGSGVVVFNPPFGLLEETEVMLPALAKALGVGTWGKGDVRWLKAAR